MLFLFKIISRRKKWQRCTHSFNNNNISESTRKEGEKITAALLNSIPVEEEIYVPFKGLTTESRFLRFLISISYLCIFFLILLLFI